MTNSDVTPAGLRSLAARAAALAADVDAVHASLAAAADEPTRRAGFRLDEAAGAADRISDALEATAGDLARVRGRSACGADWGVCPEHGNTLTSSGGTSWCRTRGCGQTWNYDRGGLPCTEPAAYEVRDANGGGGPMCAGHTLSARSQLVGATITPLTD